MQTTWNVPTDQENKLTVESKLNYIMWSQGRAYAGFEAGFELRTILVGDGARVKITCRNRKGKKLATTGGAVFRNRFRGSVVIPEKVNVGDYVYLEAKLPKLKLKDESNQIPVRAPIEVSSMGWSKDEVGRDEEVELSCVFTGGVEEDDEVTGIIKEYDADGYHDLVVKIPTTIKNSKVSLKWQFIYQEDTDDILTEEEKKKYGGCYNPPEYFFIVMVGTIPVGTKQESGLLTFRDTVLLTVRKGRIPVDTSREYIISTADGQEITKTPDEDGRIVMEKMPPGPYDVRPADKEKNE